MCWSLPQQWVKMSHTWGIRKSINWQHILPITGVPCETEAENEFEFQDHWFHFKLLTATLNLARLNLRTREVTTQWFACVLAQLRNTSVNCLAQLCQEGSLVRLDKTHNFSMTLLVCQEMALNRMWAPVPTHINVLCHYKSKFPLMILIDQDWLDQTHLGFPLNSQWHSYYSQNVKSY